MKLKRTQVQWMVPRWRNSWGFSGGDIREAEPLPMRPPQGGIAVSSHGAQLSAPHQHSRHSPGPVTSSPRKHPLGEVPDGPVTTVPSRPAGPHPLQVVCLHQERCPSASPGSQLRAGRVGTQGWEAALVPGKMTLGQRQGRAWLEFKQAGPPAAWTLTSSSTHIPGNKSAFGTIPS